MTVHSILLRLPRDHLNDLSTEHKKERGAKISCPKISMIDLWEKSKKINETISCL